MSQATTVNDIIIVALLCLVPLLIFMAGERYGSPRK